MRQYRCNLLDANLQIATTLVITSASADQDQARRLAQDIVDADTSLYFGVELWDSERLIFCHARKVPRGEGRAV